MVGLGLEVIKGTILTRDFVLLCVAFFLIYRMLPVLCDL